VTRNPELVDATDLDVYAEQRPREAEELLPHLVRRLLANTPGVTGVSVRTGSSIRMTGYDGQAHGGAGTSFVPAGPGVWELGTSNNPRKKAQERLPQSHEEPDGHRPCRYGLHHGQPAEMGGVRPAGLADPSQQRRGLAHRGRAGCR
jgi:hypothetical protein